MTILWILDLAVWLGFALVIASGFAVIAWLLVERQNRKIRSGALNWYGKPWEKKPRGR